MSLTVFGPSVSPFVRKVRIVLAEKNVGYELNQVVPFSPPDWFIEISPMKRVPVLRDSEAGDDAHNTLPDSSIICAYLEKKYPTPALYPSNPFDYAKALWFEEYADSQMAGLVGLGVFRPVIVSQMMGKDPDTKTAQETISEKLPPCFDYLNSALEGRETFVGGAFSIADISVATQFCNLAHAGYELDAERWPDLAKAVSATRSRPSFTNTMEEEAKAMESLKKLSS